MYNQTPLTAFLPSDESQFDMPVREGWKADKQVLKYAKRCGHCYTHMPKGYIAIVVNRIDPEKYAAENGLTVARDQVFCKISCQRSSYFKTMANTKKGP